VRLGTILAIWMMSYDNDHLRQNDQQVELYKSVLFNGTSDLVMEPIVVLYYNEHT
jgi:hypothetical protein